MTTKVWNIGETRTLNFNTKKGFEAAGFEQYVIEANPTDGFGTYRRITRDNLHEVGGRVIGRSILGKEYLTERNFKKYSHVREWAKDFPVFVAVGRMTFKRVK